MITKLTLVSIFHGKSENVAEYTSVVCNVLEKIHFSREKNVELDVNKRKPEQGLFFSLYVNKLQESFDKSTRLLETFPQLDSEKMSINGSECLSMVKIFQEIVQHMGDLSPPFSTRIHGDCHPRNILIRRRDNDLKIIDIDKLSTHGDYIYDYGTFLADLQVFNIVLQTRRPGFKLEVKDNVFSYELPNNENAKIAYDIILENIKKIAAKYNDSNWEKRLELAKARYLFSMVSKLADKEQSCIVYCAGINALTSLISLLKK